MKRRTELKLNDAKVFAKKYILSSRYVVRNTLGLVVLGSLTAGGIYSVRQFAELADEGAVFRAASVSGALVAESQTEEETTEQQTAEQESQTTDVNVVSSIASSSVEDLTAAAPAVETADDSTVVSYVDSACIDPASIEILKTHMMDENSFGYDVERNTYLTASKYGLKNFFLSGEDDVPIYQKPDRESKKIAYLPENAVGEIVDTTGMPDGWTKVTSNGIEGYVVTLDIKTGQKAAEAIDAAVVKVATVKRNDVCVRKEADMDAEYFYIADKDDEFVLAETIEDDSAADWIPVQLYNGSEAYIASVYVNVQDGFKTAVAADKVDELAKTVNTPEKAEESTEKADSEKTEEKTETKTEEKTETKSENKSETKTENKTEEKTEAKTEETTTSEPATEQEPAAEVQQEPVTEKKVEQVVEAPVEQAPVSDDVYLLAAIVCAESGGECYEGKLAVANVVLNRVRNGSWGSTIADVVYSPSQFTGAQTSTFRNALSTGGSDECLRAAQEALAGVNNVPGCLYFLPSRYVNADNYSDAVQIGNHVFNASGFW